MPASAPSQGKRAAKDCERSILRHTAKVKESWLTRRRMNVAFCILFIRCEASSGRQKPSMRGKSCSDVLKAEGLLGLLGQPSAQQTHSWHRLQHLSDDSGEVQDVERPPAWSAGAMQRLFGAWGCKMQGSMVDANPACKGVAPKPGNNNPKEIFLDNNDNCAKKPIFLVTSDSPGCQA